MKIVNAIKEIVHYALLSLNFHMSSSKSDLLFSTPQAR